MEVINLILIVLVWIISLPSFLIFISDQISLIGAYDRDVGYIERSIEMIKHNAYLSLPIIFAFFLIIRAAVDALDILTTFLLSLPLTLIALFYLRYLSNPNTSFLRPKLGKLFQEKYEKKYQGAIWDLHKERLLSFYYSFICAAQTILLVMWSYNILNSGKWSNVFRHFESLGFFEATLYILAYGIFLVVGSFLSELIFYFKPPIRVLENKKNN